MSRHARLGALLLGALLTTLACGGSTTYSYDSTGDTVSAPDPTAVTTPGR